MMLSYKAKDGLAYTYLKVLIQLRSESCSLHASSMV